MKRNSIKNFTLSVTTISKGETTGLGFSCTQLQHDYTYCTLVVGTKKNTGRQKKISPNNASHIPSYIIHACDYVAVRSTHIVFQTLVSPFLNQQPNHILVTIAGCNMECCPPTLQEYKCSSNTRSAITSGSNGQ
jgi:hypothetical protein